MVRIRSKNTAVLCAPESRLWPLAFCGQNRVPEPIFHLMFDIHTFCCGPNVCVRTHEQLFKPFNYSRRGLLAAIGCFCLLPPAIKLEEIMFSPASVGWIAILHKKNLTMLHKNRLASDKHPGAQCLRWAWGRARCSNMFWAQEGSVAFIMGTKTRRAGAWSMVLILFVTP